MKLTALGVDTYDWTNAPWFLDPAKAEHLWSMRYDREDLERAYAALASLYSSSFCEEYLEAIELPGPAEGPTDADVRKRRKQAGLARLLLGLYLPHGFLSGILALGVDLADVMGLKPARRWLDRFKNPHGAIGAEFELQILANAVRHGLPIRMVPEPKGKSVGIKVPDFDLTWNQLQVALEAKSLETGEHDMMGLEHVPLIHPHAPDDRAYEIEFEPQMQALAATPSGRERYRIEFLRVEAALDEKRRQLEAAGSPFGEHVVPGAGRIVIAPRDPEFHGRLASLSFTSEASPHERARRILPHLRDAAAKFRLWPERPAHIAAAVIDVPGDYNPDAIAEVIEKELRDNQADYRHTDAVIWRRVAFHIDPEGDVWKAHQFYACFVTRLRWCSVPEHQLTDLPRHILASPHRLQAPVRGRYRPDLTPPVERSLRVFLER